MPLKERGQAYCREIVTKEVWQPLWACLLNMDGSILISVVNTSTGDIHASGYVHIHLPTHFPEHW